MLRRLAASAARRQVSTVSVGSGPLHRAVLAAVPASSSALRLVNDGGEHVTASATGTAACCRRDLATDATGGQQGGFAAAAGVAGSARHHRRRHRDRQQQVRRQSDGRPSPRESLLRADDGENKAALVLPRASERMESLLRRRADLPPPPSSWLTGGAAAQQRHDGSLVAAAAGELRLLSDRIDLFDDAVDLVLILRESALGGHVSARGGRDSLVLSDLLGNSLLIFAESPPAGLIDSFERDGEDGPKRRGGRRGGDCDDNAQRYQPPTPPCSSPADAAMLVLDLLRRLNLDVRPDHYAAAIRAACTDGRWELASDLFLAEVDPDSAGMVPIDPGHFGRWDGPAELGLYAVAMLARQRQHQRDGSSPSASAASAAAATVGEEVFDAALSMSMVSPTDQEGYILAAGSALGRAGEWEACVSFLRSSHDAVKRLGQPLVAAAMQACVECSRYDVALEVYNDSVENPLLTGSEWQWGGGYGTVHPLCRDLALRSMGRASSQGGCSSDAVIILRQIIKEEARISEDALVGVFMTCERDANWRSALEILDILLGDRGEATWSVVGSSYDVLSKDDDDKSFTPLPRSPLVRSINGDMLSSIMNCCNASQEFGLALLCGRMVGLALTEKVAHPITTEGGSARLSDVLLTSHPFLLHNEQVLIATMISLCGLWCYEDAISLHESAVSEREHSIESSEEQWSNANDCSLYAKSCLWDSSHSSSAESWRSAFRHIHRLTATVHIQEQAADDLPEEKRRKLANAVAKCLECCTDAGQPRLGLQVVQQVAEAFRRPTEPPPSMGKTILSFFGLRDDEDSVQLPDSYSQSILLSSDALLASTMKAYRELNRVDEALSLFFTTVETYGHSQDAANESTSVQYVRKGEDDPVFVAENRSTSVHYVRSTNEAISILLSEGKIDDTESLFHGMDDNSRTPETFLTMARGLARDEMWEAVSDVYAMSLPANGQTVELGLLALKSIAEQTSSSSKIAALRGVVGEMAALEGVTSEAWLKDRYWTIKDSLGWYHARLLMWWNDKETAWKNELTLAVEQLEAAKLRGGFIPKNDVLRCIVHGITRAAREQSTRQNGDERSKEENKQDYSVQRSEGIELLIEALFEARRTWLGDNRGFIDDVAVGFRTLEANLECIEFIRDVLSRGVEVRKKALTQAILSAEAEGDDKALEEMVQALYEAGYRYDNDAERHQG